MKKFFAYFFGAGEEIEFRNFTLAHFLPILLTVGIIFLIYKYSDKLKNFRGEEKTRYALAFIMIVSEMSYYWRLVGVPSLNPNPHEHLPITICGWVIVFGSYLLLGKSQTLYDICYFWLFSGTLFALITPTVITYTGPTRFRYYQFWLEHTTGYIAVFYMTFVHKMRPRIKSVIKAYAALVVLAVVAHIANTTLGTGANYLFMAELEETKSMLNLLPTNFFLKLLIMGSIVTLMFVLSYLPWYFMDRKAKKKALLKETAEVN